MIFYQKINILDSKAEVLVNSVNLAGVMGKGVALAFKEAFPANFKLYKAACETKQIGIGKIFVTETGQFFPRFIVNFPTKNHWRYPSKYEWIEAGLIDLAGWMSANKIKSIAIPPLGSGNGKLDWKRVKPMIIKYLNRFETEVDIYIIEPMEINTVNLDIQSLEAKLTPARAMLIFLMNKYRVLGYEVTLLVAQKLAYFLQLLGEPLRLRFEKGHYGPYANNLVPVLKELQKGFISISDTSISKPSAIINLNRSKINDIDSFINCNLTIEQTERLKKTLDLVRDFETPFGMELLGTVDFMLRECKKDMDSEEIFDELKNWTKRKQKLFTPYHIQVAKKRLSQFFVY